MDQNMNLTDNVNTLFQSLEDFTQREGVIGKPVTQGDKTFIPVVSVTIGYGSGSSGTKSQNQSAPTGNGVSNMSGGAHGLGAKLSTDAVILIDKDTVSIIPMTPGGNSQTLVDKIPQIVAGMTNKQQSGQNQNQAQNQNQPMQAPKA